MIQDIKHGRVNTVVTPKLDRISRSLLDFYELLQLFQEHDTQFVCLKESVDTTTATGRAILKVMMAFGELEREQTSERTKETMLRRAKNGLKNGGRVWGYDLNPERKGVYLVNTEHSDLIRQIFDKYEELKSVDRVVRWLREKGIRTPVYTSRRKRQQGGKVPSKQCIIDIFRNPFYIGMIEYLGETYNGEHDAIIEKDQFERVQALLDSHGVRRRHRLRKDGGRPHEYLLRSLLFCGECGSVMTPKPGKDSTKYPYYWCVGRSRKECGTKGLPARAIEKHVLDSIRSLLVDKEALADMVRDATIQQNGSARELDSEIQRIMNAVNSVKQRMTGFLDAIENGGAASSRSVLSKISELEDEESQLASELTRLKETRNKLSEEMVDFDDVKKNYRSLSDVLTEEQDPEKLATFLYSLIDKITWYPTPDPNGKKAFIGGRYELALFDNPFISNELRKTGRESNELSSSEGKEWLPERNALHKHSHVARDFVSAVNQSTVKERVAYSHGKQS